jgi:DNA-binding transcriptional LysR family regulator
MGSRRLLRNLDVALQIGLRRNPSFRARTLYRERLVLVASPAYLQRRGAPTLVDLDRRDGVALVGVDGRVRSWRFPDGTPVTPPPAVVTVNAVGFAHQLALLGQGIARIPRTLAGPDVAAGRLVTVLPDVWVEEPVSFVFPGPPGPVARAFLDAAGGWFDRHFTPAEANRLPPRLTAPAATRSGPTTPRSGRARRARRRRRPGPRRRR